MVTYTEKLLSLHKYYVRAQLILDYSKNTYFKNEPPKDVFELILIEHGMSVYYGLLYIVVEGWTALGLKDDNVDTLLENEKNVLLLKRYRNKTFHYHKSWMPMVYTELYSEDGSAKWIINLQKNIGRALVEKIDKEFGPEVAKQLHAKSEKDLGYLLKRLDNKQ